MAMNNNSGSGQQDQLSESSVDSGSHDRRPKTSRFWRPLLSSVAALAVTIGLVATPASSASANGVQWKGGNVVLDSAFNKEVGGNLNIRGTFKTVVWDGSGYVIGGWFGSAPDYPIRVFRMNADGTLDAAFNAHTEAWQLNDTVESIVWDGSGFVIGGQFTNGPGSGAGRKSLFRINQDGSEDATFNNRITEEIADETGDEGLNRPILSIAFDGSDYLVGGYFTNGPGTGAGAKKVFKVSADGSLTSGFNDAFSQAIADNTNNEGLGGVVRSVVSDGTGYVVSGSFANGPGSGSGANRIFRVKDDGSLDGTFNNALSRELSAAGGLDKEIYSVIWDGTAYVVAGMFSNGPGAGAGAKRVFRVNPTGRLDDSFNNKLSTQLAKSDDDGLDAGVAQVIFDGSGYIISGLFANGPGSGEGAKRTFRVKEDGSLDAAFNDSLSQALAKSTHGVGLDGYVISATYDPSGIAFSGQFKNGPDESRIFRVVSTDPKPPVPPKPVIKNPSKPKSLKIKGKATAKKYKASWKAPTNTSQRPVAGYQIQVTTSGTKKKIVKNRKVSQRSYSMTRKSLIKLVPKKKRKVGKTVRISFKVYAKNSAGRSSAAVKQFKVRI